MRSLRVRIVATAAVLVTATLALMGTGVVAEVQRRLEDDLDASLRRRAEQVIAQAGADATTPIVQSPVIGSIDEDRFAQVVGPNGEVLSATSNIAGQPALAPPPIGGSELTTRDDLSIEDDVYRVLVYAFPSGSGYVVVAEDVDDLHDDIRNLIAVLLVAFPIAIGVLAAAMWWLVGRTLGPVEAIRREVASIGFDELDRRVEVPRHRDEVARLAETMNAMLDRLEMAVAQQRGFVADASHELRTPLTRLRTALEVELVRAVPDLEATCRDALADTIEMQRLVDDLLFLARHDAGASVADPEAVDLDVVVDAEVRQIRADPAVVCRIEMTGVTAAVVRGHPAQLARMVSNLLSNAVHHARGTVTVSLRDDGDTVALSVADDGVGIPQPDRERVFERFARVDAARSGCGGGGGTGLGLAIVHEIVQSHRGRVWIDDALGGGAALEVRLPAYALVSGVSDHRL